MIFCFTLVYIWMWWSVVYWWKIMEFQYVYNLCVRYCLCGLAGAYIVRGATIDPNWNKQRWPTIGLNIPYMHRSLIWACQLTVEVYSLYLVPNRPRSLHYARRSVLYALPYSERVQPIRRAVKQNMPDKSSHTVGYTVFRVSEWLCGGEWWKGGSAAVFVSEISLYIL